MFQYEHIPKHRGFYTFLLHAFLLHYEVNINENEPIMDPKEEPKKNKISPIEL